ncbi:MAG: hypothetical protein M3033_15015 [Acidobacteriota bacterium]|nr:hypothetical protein [Acidobacteriota bacterium]
MNFKSTDNSKGLKQTLARLASVLVLVCVFSAPFLAKIKETLSVAGTVITNRAEAFYQDAEGEKYNTVSQIIRVTISAVPAVAVTPDETSPSATVTANERVTRQFRICNTGNGEDQFIPTRAEVSAPAQIAGIYFDADNSGTVNDGDVPVSIGQTLTPRLAPRECQSVLFVIETGNAAPQSQIVIGLNARSNIALSGGEFAQDSGKIINAVGSGVRFTSPADTSLPPVKLVENLSRTVAAAGQTLNYNIAFRNNGEVAAHQARVIDNLPAELEYIEGSLRLNNRSVTDASDADEGTATLRRVEMTIPEIAPQAVTQIQFQARLVGMNLTGNGVVNSAIVSAANAAAVNTSDAIAVVNPVGSVYAGNSGGSARVAGARVSVATDQSGTPLTLVPNIGFAPNAENANGISTDSTGGFGFALANNQLGTTDNPARYFILASAPNYRSRILEMQIEPSGANGFFKATMRALDGQAIASANGFSLTSETVELKNLAALVCNIPMFETSTLEISKNADKQTAEIGDIVSYKIQIKNATASTIKETLVRDRLPESFVYAAGTAQIENGAGANKIEPETNGGELVFNLSDLAAGENATVSYRVRIGANTTEGEHFNSAFVTGVQPNGERITTQPARAGVRVRGGIFSMRQIVVGRVFEDRNGNGKFDKGERPVSGARVYMNNGQSVTTDSRGQYNLPAVSQGSVVLSLDPLSVPKNYHLQSEGGRRSTKSWTRLLRTPLGGGSLLRQNFAVAPDSDLVAIADDIKVINAGDGSAADNKGAANSAKNNSENKSESNRPIQLAALENKIPLGITNEKTDNKNPAPKNSGTQSSETFTVEATENVEAIAPGNLTVLSPRAEEVVMSPALSVTARVAKDWTIDAEINGEKIDASNIGETRIDNRNNVATYSFVGINLRPGANVLHLTAIGENGERGKTSEIKVYGRGAVERLEIVPAKTNAKTGGLDAVNVEIRAFDKWGNPAIDGQIAVETSAGRFVSKASAADNSKESNELARQQMVSLENGRATVQIIGDGAIDTAHLKAIAGRQEAITDIRFTPEIRPTILVGLAEFSAGRAAPEISSTGDDTNTRGHLAFYFRGRIFNTKNLLTLAYDSQKPLNRVAGRDRFGDFDPLDRAYPLFGDSSQRFEDAQSNSKVYARLDRGRSYAMFGDMEADLDNLSLSGYGRRLTGVKLHVENKNGDFVSLTGARPDTAFARDVIPGGTLSLARLSHADILPGSEVVALEVRDRRNPEIILSREQFIRSIDYNIDARTGEIFFLRPVSTFDYQLNLVQVVVTYEHRGLDKSNYVYTGRAVRHFKKLGLRVGASYVNQQQGEVGAFQLGGIDVEKNLWKGGKLSFETAMSRGRFASGVNVFDFYNPETSAQVNDDAPSRERNGIALHAKLEQPLPFFHSRLRADFQRSAGNFFNPFGATVAAGTQRFNVALEMSPTAKRNITFGFTDERNKTSNVSNSRSTFSVLWAEQWRDNLRTTIGFDHRNFSDDLTDKNISSNLLTANVEYRPFEKLELSVKREQNLGEADPTYPNQTTLAAKYQVNKYAKLFFTQRIAAAPITPIGDFSASGFASVGSRSETAFGIETKFARIGAVNGRYQLENGANGTDSFAVFGLQNRWSLTKTVTVEAGVERGFLLKGAGKSFNSASFGAAWTPVEGFRTTARYEFRDRNGIGQLFALGAAGKIGDNWTTAVRAQLTASNFGGRGASSSNITAATAYRPLNSDKYALLFSYNHRMTTQKSSVINGIAQAAMRDRADTLSSDGIYQLSKNTEIYGRFALRFNGNGDNANVYASALTYLGQVRVQQRLNNFLDVAAEARLMNQPASDTFRRSYGAELGFWALPDLRLGVGYNFSKTNQLKNTFLDNNKQFRGGVYFTVTSKLSNLFDLFGTSRKGLKAADEEQPTPNASTAQNTPDGVEQHK